MTEPPTRCPLCRRTDGHDPLCGWSSAPVPGARVTRFGEVVRGLAKMSWAVAKAAVVARFR